MALLGLLKHPLVRGGDDRVAWLAAVRRLDLALRGIRPAPGLDGIGARIDEEAPELSAWWSGVAAILDPLERRFALPLVAFTDLIGDLRDAADALCGEALWRGPAGRALAGVVGALEVHGHHLDPFVPADAPALVAAFLGETPVRDALWRASAAGDLRRARGAAAARRPDHPRRAQRGRLARPVRFPTRGSRRSCGATSASPRSNGASGWRRTISSRRSAGRRCC